MTAVEWFYQRILAKDIKEVFEQAKEMEKQQIIEAYNNGIQEMIGRNNSHIMCKHYDISSEQYYNETFKSE